jgi:hypothetical protein
MICVPCKDQLSQFYVMKQRAKSLHFNPDDIRKAAILENVSDFLDSIQEDCVVTKYSKLLSIHPDCNSGAVVDELFNCNCLLESEDPAAFSIIKEEIEPYEIDLVATQSYDQFIQIESEVRSETSLKKPPVRIVKQQPKQIVKSSKPKIACNRCGLKSFSSEKAFQIHLESHLNEPVETEPQQEQLTTHHDPSFTNQKLWVQDQLRSQKKVENTTLGTKNSWSCSICDFVTSKHSSFRNHLQKFHTSILLRGPNKHSCFTCKLRFDGENHLKVHNNCHRICDAISPHIQYPSCETCRMFFCSFEDLQIHLNRHIENPQALLDPINAVGVVHRHGETFALDDDNTQEMLDEDSPTCGHCLVKFSKENDCKVHLMLFHLNVFVCPFDSREFPGIPTLSYGNHLRQCHPDIFTDLEIKCSLCEMQFETVYDKLSHMKNCQEKNFQCDHCEKRFFKKAELQHHLKVVLGLRVFAW